MILTRIFQRRHSAHRSMPNFWRLSTILLCTLFVTSGCSMPESSDEIISKFVLLSKGGSVPVSMSEFGDKVCLMPHTTGPLAEFAFPNAAAIETVWYDFLTSDGFWSLAVWNAEKNVVYVYPIPDIELSWSYSSSVPQIELITCPKHVRIVDDAMPPRIIVERED